MCALSWRVLESHRYSQCSGHPHLLITDEQRQNILLLHDIASGRAQMKSFRISYTEPKQWSANAYTTSLQHTASHITRHPMTRCACPNSTACTHCTSTDYLTVFKTYCFSVILNPGGLSWKAIRISWAVSARNVHLHLLITSELSKHTTSPANPECARYLEEY